MRRLCIVSNCLPVPVSGAVLVLWMSMTSQPVWQQIDQNKWTINEDRETKIPPCACHKIHVVCLSFFVTITSQAANKCTQDCSHMLTLSWCVCHFTVMHCLFNSKCKSLHLNLSSLFHSHRPCHTFSLTICSSGPFVLLSHRFYLCVYYLDSSVHPFIPFIPMVVVFVFAPSSELHPSIWAPCSLHPLHRNDCNSGLDLVLVGGAGVLKGTRYGHALLSLSDALLLSEWLNCGVNLKLTASLYSSFSVCNVS